ncbi:MAG: TMEM165/GDT1 family protein [Planctomycetota bacterium]
MDWKLMATIFGSVFVAELGDTTQLATMAVAAKGQVSKAEVFVAASAALVLSTLIGVFAGRLVTEFVGEQALRYVAGVAFVAIGLWTLLRP